MEWFVACPRGFEELLAAELSELGAPSPRLTVAGAYIQGDSELAYRVCLWSRLANRVLLPLARFDVANPKDLYEAVYQIDWLQHMSAQQSFAIDFSGTNSSIRHTRFGAQTVKDAIVDYFLEQRAVRPQVDLQQPDIRLNARLAKGKCVISLDLSGASLHRRGYRQAMVAAPLKENLAAALLIRAGWPAFALPDNALIDPMCGSGTLLIEGAMMAADIAPGLKRQRFGFQQWQQHDESIWQALREEAHTRRLQGLAKGMPEIRGYDKDTRAVAAAQTNIEVMGLEQFVRVSARPVEDLKQPTHKPLANGLIITNPPYGERWGEVDQLREVYGILGERLKMEFAGWQFAAFTGNLELAGEFKLRAKKKYQLLNGQLPSKLFVYDLKAGKEASTGASQTEKLNASPYKGFQAQSPNNQSPSTQSTNTQSTSTQPTNRESTDTQPASNTAKSLSAGAQMLANRLLKNQRKLQPWLKREGISCYRLYDNDLPEYAAAVDIYEQAIHIQEYAPPSTIDSHTANQRLHEVKLAVTSCFPEFSKAIYLKERRRQKGSNQYQRFDQSRANSRANSRARAESTSVEHIRLVKEGKAEFEINLSDYLDTGLFLDHRPIRKTIADSSAGKSLLNLFCYTGAVTVQAALGGCASSVSIDMSNTYLEWAQRNFTHNKLGEQHQLLRADCLQWLSNAGTDYTGAFDIIFLDPPTFSNSKAMEAVLDIQRDHSRLLDQAMALLANDGVLFFSNNFRRFKLDPEVRERYQVEDITRQSIPLDFSRNTKIHNCWQITHG